MEADTKSSPARVAAKTPASDELAAEKFIEVELIKKYVPHHCYDVVDGLAMLQRDDRGNPVKQKDVVVGEAQDKFGRPVEVKREILEAIPPGTRIEIPRSEAVKLINAGKAQLSAKSFG